ncbi:MAG TPA: hypothetical protein PK351_12665 [Spirochaetota bacterium]|nr:hypothetical protein [Spirochaetota bacterium]
MKYSLIILKLFLRITKIKKLDKRRELSYFSSKTTPFYKAIYNDCYRVVGFEECNFIFRQFFLFFL